MNKIEESAYIKKKLHDIDIEFKKIEKVIDNNKEDFDTESLKTNHEEKFMTRLRSKIKNCIDLTPYLVKVAIITIIIFIGSFLIWNSFIRKDKNKPVIENVIEQFKKKK